MRKQKPSAHPKAEAARTRKQEQRSASLLAEEAARQDAYWQDEDKLSRRKQQRREGRETRRVEELDRRAELRRLEADETQLMEIESRPKSEYIPLHPLCIQGATADILCRSVSGFCPA